MKLKIQIKLFEGAEPLELKEQGDWFDLKCKEDVFMEGPFANTLNGNRTKRDVEFCYQQIPLGVAMKLPSGCEAVCLPRSSTPRKWGIILANSQGVIDHTYQGNGDEWHFPAIAIRDVHIPKGTSIAQFRIQPSQKATFWQKLKFLLSSGVEIEYVENLDAPDRGGLGSTGDK